MVRVTKTDLDKLDSYLEARRWERKVSNLLVVGVAILLLGMVIWVAFNS